MMNDLLMSRIRVLILSDGLGWIVDRITDEMIRRMPFEFTKADYTKVATDWIVSEGNRNDLVHYQNWDIGNHVGMIESLTTPLLVSCRSHRSSQAFRDNAHRLNVHVITPYIQEEFPESVYIPDGIFDEFFRKGFTVGFAGRPDEYKGFGIIRQACEDIGATFSPALNVQRDKMKEYYESVDVVVVGSLNEGHNTIAMECAALNKPFLTTDVGIPRMMNFHKFERNVEALKTELLKFYTYGQVKEFTWENSCKQLTDLYLKLCKKS